MGRPIFSPGKEWAGPFFPRGKKLTGGEIPACCTGIKIAINFSIAVLTMSREFKILACRNILDINLSTYFHL